MTNNSVNAATTLQPTVHDVYSKRYEPEVRRAALLVGSSSHAHDIVAEAFCDLIRRWDGLRSPEAYLSTAVLNGCRKLGPKLRREQPSLIPDWRPSDNAAPNHMYDAIAKLPWKQRAVVTLKYYEDLTEREIADLTGMRPGSVGPTLKRALAKLRLEVE